MRENDMIYNLEKELRGELVNHLIPFWKGLRDNVYGGYYGYMGFDLRTDRNYEKGAILNSRILWFFSSGFRILQRVDLLMEARHAYEFLLEHFLDREYGGLYWSVSCEGEPIDTTKHTYNQAFAIYALSVYYQACGCTEALRTALELFEEIESTCKDTYGYLESFTRTWEPEENEKLSENGLLADKTMKTLLHLLEAYTELYQASGDGKVAKALTAILEKFCTQVYNPRLRHLEVFFDAKMQSISDLYSYGHDIEASWLIDRACDVLENYGRENSAEAMTSSPVIPAARTYADIIAEESWRNAFTDEAMNNECFCGKVDTTKVWWVQAESIVGFYNQYCNTGKVVYLETAYLIWEYVKQHLIDPRKGGEWFWQTDEKGVPDGKKPVVDSWKCPYHNGRMCMEIMSRAVWGSRSGI